MNFTDKLQRELEKSTSDVLVGMLESGFTFDMIFAGEKCGFRRCKDLIQDPDTGKLYTEFFCFPQNGKKDKLQHGLCFSVVSTVEDFSEKKSVFADAGQLKCHKAGKVDIYYSHVASRAGKQIAETGANTFLHNDVVIFTPENECILLDDFDFAKNSLFMLGLYGGEYKIGVKE